MRCGPDIRFREAALDERTSYAGFFRGLEPGAVVAEIVAVGAVQRDRELPLEPLGLGDVVELAFAVKAPIRLVGDVPRVGHLVRLDDAVVGADFAGELPCVIELSRWQRRRDGGHADSAGAELARRDGEHEGAVDAARVAHESRSKLAHVRGKSFELGLDRVHARQVVTPGLTLRISGSAAGRKTSIFGRLASFAFLPLPFLFNWMGCDPRDSGRRWS